jgi:hypothetical protein
MVTIRLISAVIELLPPSSVSDVPSAGSGAVRHGTGTGGRRITVVILCVGLRPVEYHSRTAVEAATGTVAGSDGGGAIYEIVTVVEAVVLRGMGTGGGTIREIATIVEGRGAWDVGRAGVVDDSGAIREIYTVGEAGTVGFGDGGGAIREISTVVEAGLGGGSNGDGTIRDVVAIRFRRRRIIIIPEAE